MENNYFNKIKILFLIKDLMLNFIYRVIYFKLIIWKIYKLYDININKSVVLFII